MEGLADEQIRLEEPPEDNRLDNGQLRASDGEVGNNGRQLGGGVETDVNIPDLWCKENADIKDRGLSWIRMTISVNRFEIGEQSILMLWHVQSQSRQEIDVRKSVIHVEGFNATGKGWHANFNTFLGGFTQIVKDFSMLEMLGRSSSGRRSKSEDGGVFMACRRWQDKKGCRHLLQLLVPVTAFGGDENGRDPRIKWLMTGIMINPSVDTQAGLPILVEALRATWLPCARTVDP
ncbi:hypothetical protein DFH09DRAFT_1074841 [Mycena vulgaris]|nr:hypothetical protein DFH09DRAFT_1074841 [Mycena vulgaris]